MKIVSIVGARPQFIKAAVVSRALTASGIAERMVHTGQHYDHAMSDAFFVELEMTAPAEFLEVGSASHGAQTGAMLAAVEQVLEREAPDGVLVYGDTNSTLAGALAAVKLHVPVAHVEAGLRSFNRRMPEEINRVVTDHVSTILFTPTILAGANLAAEGIAGDLVHFVGDVMYDLALLVGDRLDDHGRLVDELGLDRFALATIHRAENTDDPARLQAIFDGLGLAARELPIVLPLHPRTRKVLAAGAAGGARPGLHLVDPLGYLDMAALERRAEVVVTDSGGVQKEAFFHGTPCVTLRDETEWVELVELGWNRLAPPTSADAVAAAVLSAAGTSGRLDAHPYGDGDASAKIAAVLAR